MRRHAKIIPKEPNSWSCTYAPLGFKDRAKRLRQRTHVLLSDTFKNGSLERSLDSTECLFASKIYSAKFNKRENTQTPSCDLQPLCKRQNMRF